MESSLVSRWGRLGLGLLLLSATGQGAPLYSVTDLGILPGGLFSVATDLNNSGQVVGYASTANGARAFVFSNGSMQNLGTLPDGNVSYAWSINDAGQIAGSSRTRVSSNMAFVYSNGILSALNTPAGTTRSIPHSINNSGQITLDVTISGTSYAYLLSGGTLQNLGWLPGGNYANATDVNDSGHVSGGSALRAFLYASGVLHDLATLPGHTSSHANGINDSGVLVGYSQMSSSQPPFLPVNVPFIYSGGSMQAIPGIAEGVANDVNNNGDVVGYRTSLGSSQAFVYSSGTVTDLSAALVPGSGWAILDAVAINDSGQIAANGFHTGLGSHALLLTPVSTVPEAGTSSMVSAAALIAVLCIVRRRSKWRGLLSGCSETYYS